MQAGRVHTDIKIDALALHRTATHTHTTETDKQTQLQMKMGKEEEKKKKGKKPQIASTMALDAAAVATLQIFSFN